MRRACAIALVLGVASSAGCSLLNLDQFPLAMCGSNADCEPVNTAHGIAPGACMRYQCIASMNHACALTPRDSDGDGDGPITCGGTDCDDGDPRRAGTSVMAHEVCDGVDNDCNSVIDEGAVQPRTTQTLLTDAAGVTLATYAPVPGGTAIAMTTTTARGDGWNVLAGTSVAPATVQTRGYMYQYAIMDNAASYDQPALAAGCLQSDPSSPDGMGGVCNTTDVVAAAPDGSGYSIVAAVNTQGCPAGQLRIGYVGPDDPGDAIPHPSGIVIRGPLSRSNLAMGVDPDPSAMRCTGFTIAAHGGMHGAARPSIAAMTAANRLQAVVAFLGGPIARNACTDAQVPVEVLGVWLSAGGTADVQVPIHWTNGTGSGIPDVVGQTTGGGRPGTAAWSTAAAPGFFVGFGNTTHQVELHFIAGLPAPPAPPMVGDHVYIPSPTASLGASIGAPFNLPSMAGGAADHVVLQPGASDANAIDLGVSWIEGCGASSTVLFQRLHYVSGSPGAWASAGAPVVLDTTAQPVSATMAYVPSGFVVPGYTRAGATATAQTSGGWVVGWIGANGHFHAQRIAAFDGQPIVEAVIDVGAAAAGAASFPVLYPSDTMHADLLHYAHAAGSGLVGGDLLCGDGTTFP